MKLAVEKTSREIYHVILKDLGSYGGFPLYGIAILVFLLSGDALFAYKLAASLVVITIVVSAVRMAYFKPRPGMPRRKYGTLYERIDGSSFPSIHAARAVMISMALMVKAYVLLPVYVVLVTAVCLSRIHFRRHDLKDVVAGLLIGYALGYYFFF